MGGGGGGGGGGGVLLVVTFSLNANITCKTYLKIKASFHGTMKKIWFYRF